MGILGDYVNTAQRVNPAQGLIQGFNQGSQFMFALQQQKMQQQQFEEQKKEKEKADDIREMTVLLDAAKQVKSKTMQSQILQRFFDKYGKHNPEYAGITFDLTDTANDFMTKARGLKKLGTENPDLFLKEVDNLVKEAYEAESKGNIEEKQRKDVVDTVSGMKKEVAGELGGLATYPEQFRSDSAYQTPEAKAGIEGYQKNLLSQATALDPAIAKGVSKELQETRSESFKPPQPWGFMTTPEGSQKAVGFDPTTRKVVTYDMPYNGQVTPFALGRTPASEVKTGTQLDTLKDNLNRIKENYNKDYVGFITGRAKQLQANTVGGLPEKQSVFYADVNDIADMLLRARSGAQINEQEYQRLSKLVPTPNLPSGTFEARLKRFEEQLNQTLKNQQVRLKQGGYIAPKGKTESGNKIGRFTVKVK